MSKDYQLKNDKGKTIAMGSLDQMYAWVKHHSEDGQYNIVGVDTDLVVERVEGVVYPTAGTVEGEKLPPRDIASAKGVFKPSV